MAEHDRVGQAVDAVAGRDVGVAEPRPADLDDDLVLAGIGQGEALDDERGLRLVCHGGGNLHGDLA